MYDPKGQGMGSGSPSLSFLGSKIERSTIAGRDLATRDVASLGPAPSPLRNKPSSRAGSLPRSGRDASLHFGVRVWWGRGSGSSSNSPAIARAGAGTPSRAALSPDAQPSFPGDRGRDTPGPGTYEGAAAAALKLARALKGV